ncbi:uncharacterized protein B0H64DRAFT_224573 [Chaetomium fimeti]|uniref:Uncharacterized protein n=1 Tax=Chaetomium fimeti TaxID=1854472 RepID=A0AAE0H942_9PEZI|nr:hypothetical protein B0H64DRAFT_224573 [Chaetomium fimeti]
MAANIDLGVLEDPDIPQCQVDVLRILDAALNSSGDPATAAAKLADDLRQFFISSESQNTASTLLWNLWMVLLEAVMMVPVGHPWHAALVAAVKGLRSPGGPVVELEGCTLQWADLPHLSEYLFDKWADPTDPDDDDYDPEDLEAWKSFNSFASQLLSDDLPRWIVLPYWVIRAALETPLPQDPDVFECRLWVATEWLTRCGQLVRREMGSTEPLSEQSRASIAPGPLCEGVPPLGPERWEFWRSRLIELASAQPPAGEDGAGEDGVGEDGTGQQPVPSGESLDRIAQAIAVMDAASNDTQGLGRCRDDGIMGSIM